MLNKEIYSKKLSRSNRTYFFDLNIAQRGGLYLQISESKKTTIGLEHFRLIIDDADIVEFGYCFEEILKRYLVAKKRISTRREMIKKV